jgi:hypothetical protein
MKKSQIVNNMLKPNRVIEGKQNEPIMFYRPGQPIYFPKRKKYK